MLDELHPQRMDYADDKLYNRRDTHLERARDGAMMD
jgi:hypothetical protein